VRRNLDVARKHLLRGRQIGTGLGTKNGGPERGGKEVGERTDLEAFPKGIRDNTNTKVMSRTPEGTGKSTTWDVGAPFAVELDVETMDIPAIKKRQKTGGGQELISSAEFPGGVWTGMVKTGPVSLCESSPAETPGLWGGRGRGGEERFDSGAGAPRVEKDNRKYHIDQASWQIKQESGEVREEG
jgi:hypothetical protein